MALVIHIVASIGWMGMDIALFSLLITAQTTDDPTIALSSFVAVGIAAPVGVGILSLAMLVTRVVLSLGTKWGLVRYWWVLIKLVIGVVITALVFVSLIPGLLELSAMVEPAASADAVRAQIGSYAENMMYPPVVSFVLLGVSAVLSVFKPWGKIRRVRRPAARVTVDVAR